MNWRTVMLAVAALALCAYPALAASPVSTGNEDALVFADRLAKAYHLKIERSGDTISLLLPGGRRIPWRSATRLPEHPYAASDIRSIFLSPYPKTVSQYTIKDKLNDPGRFRNYALFKAVYGADEVAVSRNLEPVMFAGLQLMFNRNNGAAAALRRVAGEIAAQPKLRNYLSDLVRRDIYSIGTVNWSIIAGSTLLSPHSFGIAIDIIDRASTQIGYWQWATPDLVTANDWPLHFRQNRIWNPPEGLVALFEKHGFIWGGKWYHFDSIHFEYRPELATNADDPVIPARPPCAIRDTACPPGT